MDWNEVSFFLVVVVVVGGFVDGGSNFSYFERIQVWNELDDFVVSSNKLFNKYCIVG